MSAPPLLLCGLILSHLACVLSGCGTERELSGIWQQAPVEEGVSEEGEELAWDEGLEVLYELHLGRYGERVTGVVVRYQTPRTQYLSPFDRADRCDCALIYQGSALTEPQRVAFGLLDPQTPRSIDTAPSCALEAECARVFKLTLEGGELVGTSWCEGEGASKVSQVRFVKAVGLSVNRCEPTL